MALQHQSDIPDEADRRYATQALLDRVRPGGRFADDLTPFSDDEPACICTW
ncbi:hypothetical protein [Streptomyces tailanensis]|uniref:hypothetical protein n=1 Tax=Streptomyces tailanensis TaxID=2569858 RepID=UPI00155ADA75|nr:hypothetical protein [Streptomyces tailanensis]